MANVKFYSKEQVDALLPGAGELVPSTSGASAGDVLTYDGSDVGWDAPSGGLPDPTSATAGDVLTLDSNKDAIWQTPGGGSGMTAHTYSTWGQIYADLINKSQNDYIVTTTNNAAFDTYFGVSIQPQPANNRLLVKSIRMSSHDSVCNIYHYSAIVTSTSGDYVTGDVKNTNLTTNVSHTNTSGQYSAVPNATEVVIWYRLARSTE